LGLGGLMLRRLLKALKARNVPLAAYGSMPQADALYKALGMTHVGQAPRYVLPLSIGPIVRRHVASRPIADLISILPDLALRLRSRLLLSPLRSGARGHTVTARDDFDASSVPADPPEDGRVRLKRTADWLNWKIRYGRAIDQAEIKAFVVRDPEGHPAASWVTSGTRRSISASGRGTPTGCGRTRRTSSSSRARTCPRGRAREAGR
jgi:hypothetical protein